MSLSLPGKRKVHHPVPKKNNQGDSDWSRHRERMMRVRTFNYKHKLAARFNVIENNNTIQNLLNVKELCCFNEHSWHHHNVSHISKFIIQKNGKKILAFSNNDNKHVGFLCKINSSTNMEGLLNVVLSTKFPTHEKDNFLILFACRQLSVSQKIKPLMNNCYFFNRFYKLIENGNYMFEL